MAINAISSSGLFLLPFVITLQHRLTTRQTNFIVDLLVLYQIILVLVQLYSSFEADRIDQQMVVQVVRVAVCVYQHRTFPTTQNKNQDRLRGRRFRVCFGAGLFPPAPPNRRLGAVIKEAY